MGTRLTLTETVRRYIDEEDSANSHFSDDEIYDYVNQAIRYLGTDLEWPLQLAQATSVADQAVYTLPDDFISLAEVYFDNSPLTILDRGDLKHISSQWQESTASLPRYAYKQDNRKFGVWPKPDSDHADLAIQIQYVKLPPDLDSDTAVPDLHTAFQDCLPFYASFLCEHKIGNTKRADKNYEFYDLHKKRIQSKLQRFSDDLMRLRWPR